MKVPKIVRQIYPGALIKTKKISKSSKSPARRTPNGGLEQREEVAKRRRFVKGADDALAAEIASNRGDLPSEFDDGILTYYIDLAGNSLSPETLQTVSARVSREPIPPSQERFIEQFFDSIDYLTGMDFKRVRNPGEAERVIGQVSLTAEDGSIFGFPADLLTSLSGNTPRNGPEGAKDVWVFDSGRGWDKPEATGFLASRKYRFMNAILVSFGFKDLGIRYPASQTVMGADQEAALTYLGADQEYGQLPFERGVALPVPEAGYLKPTDYRALLYSFGEP
jgi:hypothetical protein